MGRDMSEHDTNRTGDWKPILKRGPDGERIYCSRGCGHGCHRADYDRAHERGAALAKLLGQGWSYRVWENMGWHVAAYDESGFINVHPPYGTFTADRGKYHILISDEPGKGAGRWIFFDEDPFVALVALQKIIRIEKDLVARISAAVDVAALGETGNANANATKKKSRSRSRR